MIPLLALSAVSTVCSYLLAFRLSHSVYDKELTNSADSIVTRMTVEGNNVRVTLLPTDTEDIVTHNHKDQFLYQVLSTDGKKLAGLNELPNPQIVPATGESPVFRDDEVNGQPVRVAVFIVPVPDSPLGSVVMQVAETLNSRRELAQNILLGIILPQLVLIGIAGGALRVGVFKGIAPLYKIKDAVERRSPQDLSPIDDGGAPDEVKSLLTAFNALLSRARDDIARQQRFASNAAHQLRTPLAGLNTYLELAEKINKEDELSTMIRQLHNGVDRMTRTVQQLLSLSRAEQAPVPFTSVDLNLVVSDAATDLVPEAIQRNVEIEFQVAESPALIFGDPISLKEMTTNLLENAIRYNRPGGQVVVSVSKDNRSVNLCVEDDGIGIPESERSKVFERFYRISGSDLDVLGSGLGLSIVGEIAKIHRARVEVHDGRERRGTKILVNFPENGVRST